MAKGLTYEEMLKLGAQPAQSQGLTYDEMVKAGATPAPPSLVDPREVSGLGAFVIRAGDALTGGHMVELGSGVDAALDKLTGKPGSLVDLYRSNRERNTAIAEKNVEEHPNWAKAGTGAGIAAQIALPVAKGAKALKAGGTLGKAMWAGAKTGAAQGAGFGALAGLGDSKADLTRGEWDQAAADALVSSIFGGALGGLTGGAAPALLPPLAKAAGWAGEKLQNVAIGPARRVLQGGSDISAATRKPLSDAAVKEALESRAIALLGTTKGASERLDDLAASRGKLYGEIIKALEARGVTGPEAMALALRLEKQAAEVAENSLLSPAPDHYRKAAMELLEKPLAQGEKLKLSQAEAIKQNLQRQASKEYKRVGGDTDLGDAKVDIARVFREANESAVDDAARAAGPGSEVARLAADFQPVKRQLGRTIEARDVAQRGASKAAQRNALGLPERLAIGMGLATGNIPAAINAAAGAGLMGGLLSRGASTTAAGAYGLGRTLKGVPAALLGSGGVRAQSLSAAPAASKEMVELLDSELSILLTDDERERLLKSLLGAR